MRRPNAAPTVDRLTQARHALLLDRLRLSAAVGDLGQSEVAAANALLTP